MPRKWTSQQKQKQRELIATWQPWKRSTGAQSEAGKQKVSLNALKHGDYTAAAIEERKALNNLLREFRDVLASIHTTKF